MDLVIYFILRLGIFLVLLLPQSIRLLLVEYIIRLVIFALPKYRRIAFDNLDRCYPTESLEWKGNILNLHYKSLARLIVDFIRLPEITEVWVRKNIDCPFWSEFIELKRNNPGVGVLIATGHLGSFELLANVVAIMGNPLSAIARPFKLPRVEEWWRTQRESLGNRIILRKGAVKATFEEIKCGRDVAILFDQNVTANHAVFVNFFGVQAATTRTLAMVALKFSCPVVVASMEYLGDDRYRINAEKCELSNLLIGDDSNQEFRIKEITQRISSIYEGMIRRRPEEWFWFHRRFRTRPIETITEKINE